MTGGAGSDNGGNVRALAELEAANTALQEALAAVKQAREWRAVLIVACYRRGIPLRRIAKVAGVHYTRVRQLVGETDRRAGKKGNRHT